MAVAVGQYQKNGKQSSLDRETEAISSLCGGYILCF